MKKTVIETPFANHVQARGKKVAKKKAKSRTKKNTGKVR